MGGQWGHREGGRVVCKRLNMVARTCADSGNECCNGREPAAHSTETCVVWLWAGVTRCARMCKDDGKPLLCPRYIVRFRRPALISANLVFLVLGRSIAKLR